MDSQGGLISVVAQMNCHVVSCGNNFLGILLLLSCKTIVSLIWWNNFLHEILEHTLSTVSVLIIKNNPENNIEGRVVLEWTVSLTICIWIYCPLYQYLLIDFDGNLVCCHVNETLNFQYFTSFIICIIVNNRNIFSSPAASFQVTIFKFSTIRTHRKVFCLIYYHILLPLVFLIGFSFRAYFAATLLL